MLGVESDMEYLKSKLGWYPVAMEQISDLPGELRILILWDERGFYAPLNSTADPLIDRWYLDSLLYQEPEKILKSWRYEGYTHLLIYRLGMEFERQRRTELTQEHWQMLDTLLDSLQAPTSYGETYELYSIQ